MEGASSYINLGSLPEEDDEDNDDDEGSFVDEGYQPANFKGDQEPSWASSVPYTRSF